MDVLAQIFMVFVITGHNTNPWTDKHGAPTSSHANGSLCGMHGLLAPVL